MRVETIRFICDILPMAPLSTIDETDVFGKTLDNIIKVQLDDIWQRLGLSEQDLFGRLHANRRVLF